MAESQDPELDLIAVGAHPDDVEIACGGTLARLVRKGYAVGIVDLTDVSINVNLLPGQLTVPVANQSPIPLVFTYPGPGSSASPTPASSYMLGTGTDQFLSPAVQGILNSGLSLKLSTSSGLLSWLGDIVNPILGVVTGPILSALATTLVPLLLQPIDSLLTSVTGLLGLSLGNAYVTNTPDSIKCGNPMLVQ